MSEKVNLKRKYVKLLQENKKDEALVVLRQIWNFGKENPIEVKKQIITKDVVITKVKKSSKKKEEIKILNKSKFVKINDLSRIKGIGKETINDLKSIYSCVDDLINDIISGKKLPLRNDVESKLKKELL